MTSKRSFNSMSSDIPADKGSSPFLPAFENFRSELDAHYETREKIVKASRDITAASKKIVRTLNKPLAANITKTTQPHYEVIRERLASVAADIQSVNAYRYGPSISPGIQELQEAVLFQYYLETQTLPSLEQSSEKMLALMPEGNAFALQLEDYVLGLYDMTGELMRFLINSIATVGFLPSGSTQMEKASNDQSMDVEGADQSRTALDDLREMRFRLELMEAGSSWFGKSSRQKLSVTQASVEKVEKSLYGIVVRGSERPKGWIPDLREERPISDES